MPEQTQQFAGTVRDPSVDKEFTNILAALDTINRWGQWTTVVFDPALFWSNSGGTWIPKAEQIFRLKWAVIGRTMILDVVISAPAITGTVTDMFIRFPLTGYRIVPNIIGGLFAGAENGLVIDNSIFVSGVIGPDQGHPETIVLRARKFDASAFTVNAGIIGKFIIQVQPQ